MRRPWPLSSIHMTHKRLESPKKNALSQSQIFHFSSQKRTLSLPLKNLIPWILINSEPLEKQIFKKSNSLLLILQYMKHFKESKEHGFTKTEQDARMEFT